MAQSQTALSDATFTPDGIDDSDNTTTSSSSGSKDAVEKYRTRSILIEVALKRVIEKNEKYAATNSALEDKVQTLTQMLTEKSAQLCAEEAERAEVEREYERELSGRRKEIISLQNRFASEAESSALVEKELRMRLKSMSGLLAEKEREDEMLSNRLRILQSAYEKAKKDLMAMSESYIELQEKTAAVSGDSSSSRAAEVESVKEEIDKLTGLILVREAELSDAQQTLGEIEQGYLEEIARLEAFIDDVRRSEGVDRAQSANLLQVAVEEAAQLRALLREREEQLSALQAQLSSSSASDKAGLVEALSQRATMYEYLLAGDLRQQRGLIEQQTAMLAALAERMPPRAAPGLLRRRTKSLRRRAKSAAQALLHSLAFLVGKGPYAAALDAPRGLPENSQAAALQADLDGAYKYEPLDIEDD